MYYDVSPVKMYIVHKLDYKTIIFIRRWLEEQNEASKVGRKPSFKRALFKGFFWQFIPGGIMLFMYISIR